MTSLEVLTVGRVGVAIDSIDDMKLLFDGIPLDEVSTSMTINAPAAALLLLYELVGEEQGVPAEALRGTTQNDVLKEYIARGTYIYPPEPTMRLSEIGSLLPYHTHVNPDVVVSSLNRMIDDVVAGYVTAATEGFPEEWDLDALWAAMKTVYPVSLRYQELERVLQRMLGVERELVSVPAHHAHNYTNASEQPASMLVVLDRSSIIAAAHGGRADAKRAVDGYRARRLVRSHLG